MAIIDGKERERYRKVKIDFGLKRFSASRGIMYPSEPRYVQYMQAQAQALTDTINSIIDQFEDITPDIMVGALEPTLEKAKYYCPKDTNELVDSAYLEITSFKGRPRVECGFAKDGKPFYAGYVHEILDYKHEEPTRAKFLEQAMKEDLEAIFKRLGALYWESLFA